MPISKHQILLIAPPQKNSGISNSKRSFSILSEKILSQWLKYIESDMSLNPDFITTKLFGKEDKIHFQVWKCQYLIYKMEIISPSIAMPWGLAIIYLKCITHIWHMVGTALVVVVCFGFFFNLPHNLPFHDSHTLDLNYTTNLLVFPSF